MLSISCTCDNLLCVFSVLLCHVPLQGSEKRNCGWWYQGCEIQSFQFYPSHFLPQNSGKCNCRGWGVIFVQNYNISCTLSFSFSHLKTRENVGVGSWWFVQFMHMFNISCSCGNLICMLPVFFHVPLQGSGK